METTLTPEQRQIRIGRVTGSRIGAIASVSLWQGPLEVYDEMAAELRDGPGPGIEDNEHMERGRFLEGALRDWTAHRTELDITKTRAPGTIIHPEYDFIAVSPDGEAYEPDQAFEAGGSIVAAVELKSPGGHARIGVGDEDWQDPLTVTDGIPEYYIPQVTLEAAVLGVEETIVSALIGGLLKVYRVPLDHELFQVLVDLSGEFVENLHKGIAPEIDGSTATNKYLRKRFSGHDTGKPYLELAPDDDGFDHVVALRDVRAEIKRLEKDKVGIENEIMDLIGDAPGLDCGLAGKIHWKLRKDSQRVDKALVFEYCDEHGIDVAQFQKTIKGSRVFDPRLK